MDIGASFGLLIVVVLALAAVAGFLWWQRGRAVPASPPVPAPPRQEPETFEHTLRELHAAGRWPELLRLLDRSLPEWPVSSSLIEVARAVSALERDIAAARGNVVSEVVIGRLTAQTEDVATGLWSLADRIVVANRMGSAQLRDQLAREDEALLRLLPAMQEAQAGLAELLLTGGGGGDLRRAEGRFLALAATARELQELGPAPSPR